MSIAYDGNPHGTTAEVYGVGVVDLGPATIAYSGVNEPLNVGTTLVTATFAGNQDYTAASASTTMTITAGTSTPTLTLTPVSVTYDGAAQHGRARTHSG